MSDQRRLKLNCWMPSNQGFQLKGVILSSPDARQKGWKPASPSLDMQLPGEVWNPLPYLVLNLSLPDGTWKPLEKRDIVVSVVSTFILHDNTAGGISVFCWLWTLTALCLCDIAVPKPIPFSNFLSQELTQSPVLHHFKIPDCHFQKPFQPVK